MNILKPPVGLGQARLGGIYGPAVIGQHLNIFWAINQYRERFGQTAGAVKAFVSDKIVSDNAQTNELKYKRRG